MTQPHHPHDTRRDAPSAPLPALLLTPRRSALLAGHDNTLDVLVRVQAPDTPVAQPQRHPLNLALVIDRSGSMSGQPLAEAKRCAEFVLDGLTLCARRLKLEVGAPQGGIKARVLNDYAVAEHGAWWLPDLAYAGEAWAVLRLKVPAALLDRGAGLDGAVPVVGIGLRYVGVDGEPRAIQPITLALPVLSAPAFAAIEEDELVARRVGELEAAELQHKARRAAMRGEWGAVQSLLRRAERLGADNPWIAAAVADLHVLAARRDDVLFAKQSAYGSLRMSTRLASRAESVDFADATDVSYLRRKANPGKAGEPPASRPR